MHKKVYIKTPFLKEYPKETDVLEEPVNRNKLFTYSSVVKEVYYHYQNKNLDELLIKNSKLKIKKRVLEL